MLEDIATLSQTLSPTKSGYRSDTIHRTGLEMFLSPNFSQFIQQGAINLNGYFLNRKIDSVHMSANGNIVENWGY